MHTSYNGSDKGKEDVLLVADADLLVVHLDEADIYIKSSDLDGNLHHAVKSGKEAEESN